MPAPFTTTTLSWVCQQRHPTQGWLQIAGKPVHTSRTIDATAPGIPPDLPAMIWQFVSDSARVALGDLPDTLADDASVQVGIGADTDTPWPCPDHARRFAHRLAQHLRHAPTLLATSPDLPWGCNLPAPTPPSAHSAMALAAQLAACDPDPQTGMRLLLRYQRRWLPSRLIR